MLKIATLTLNPAIDKSSSAESVAAEIKIRCEIPQFDPGGGGINVSRAVKKLGGESLALFTSGGLAGMKLQQLLSRENIQQQILPIADDTRENLTVYERSTTLQYRFGMPGPVLSEEEWRMCLEAFIALDAEYLIASGSLPRGVPEGFYAELARRAVATGHKIIVDTSGGALAALRGAGVFLVKPNIGELETLSGQKFAGEMQLKAAGQALIADGLAQVLVVSLGSAGAALITASDFVQMRPPVVPIQSKVGAGDSMVGGIVTALSRGWSLEDAVRYGVASGTAAVMTSGTELCRLEDVEAIYPRVALFH